MNHLSLVIKREYLTKVKNKSFIIMTILSPIIMIALIAVVAYLSQLNNNRERTIAILDQSNIVEEIFENKGNTKYEHLENIDLETAKALVEEKAYYGLIYIDKETDIDAIAKSIKFYSKESPSITLISNIEGKLERKLTDLKLKSQNVDLEKIRLSQVDVDIAQESFEGENREKTKTESYG